MLAVKYLGTIISTAGHVSCIGVLCGTNVLIGVIDLTGRSIVKVISFVTGATIEQDARIPHAERVRTFQDKNDHLIVHRPKTGSADGGKSGPNQVLDEGKTLEKTVEYAKEQYSDFFENDNNILGDEAKLTELATNLICNELGGTDPSLLAKDFQFLFPVVGPLTKTQFIEAFTNFKVRDAFPTSSANFYNFKIDPLEPNRIWMFSRGAYEHLGTLFFGTKFPATNKRICLPPQCFSMSFDASGKCYKLTGGYNVDRSVGDTSGLGGMFGIIHALGLTTLPFPEGRPWKRSLMWEALALRVPQIVEDLKALSADKATTSKPKSD